MPVIRSIRATVVHEIPKIKGSSFIGAVAPAADRATAEAFLETRRAGDPQATHHCFAYRLGLGENELRFSDDGEPSGTAGRPILKEIDGRALTDVVAVVTRYYGGTKLGSGGLVRAYGGAAAAALDRAEIVEHRLTVTLSLAFDYERLGAIQGVLHAFGLAPTSAAYGTDVTMTLAVPVEDRDRVASALTDATAGQARVDG